MSSVISQSQNEKINVRVLFFGAAREAVGRSEVNLALSGPADAANAFAQVLTAFPGLQRFGRSLLFAVNQEYARLDLEVCEGDELAVFPPVSGGSGEEAKSGGRGEQKSAGSSDVLAVSGHDNEQPRQSRRLTKAYSYDFFELTTQPIEVGAVARRVVLPQCGATVTLDGYAREWTNGRRTLYLLYEAYAPMALIEMERLGREAHEQFAIAQIGIVHRTGRLAIGETSVVIAVSATHRRAAFEACEWTIRELKRTVPIWKKEVFADGEVWVAGTNNSES